MKTTDRPWSVRAGLIVVLLYYVTVWFKVGRDPAKSSIMLIYEPPAGVSPAAMRYLVRMGFDDKTVAVAVIAMAVKKFLSIKEANGVFTLQRIGGDKKILAPEESAAAAKLFAKSRGKDHGSVDDPGRSDVVVLKPNKNNNALRNAVTAVKKALHNAEDNIYFVANQHYLIPGLILSAVVVVAMVAAETGDRRFVLGFFSAWLTGWSVAVFFLLCNAVHLWKGARAAGSGARAEETSALQHVVCASICRDEIGALFALAWFTLVLVVLILAALVGANLMFHWLLKAPTRAGRNLLDKIDGFRMFLQAVDGDRLNRLMPPEKTPELFEKDLPYAVALDSEQAWAQQFAAVLEQAGQTTGYSPTWYVASHAFAMSAFALSFSGSFSNAIAASVSTPGTSSGAGVVLVTSAAFCRLGGLEHPRNDW